MQMQIWLDWQDKVLETSKECLFQLWRSVLLVVVVSLSSPSSASSAATLASVSSSLAPVLVHPLALPHSMQQRQNQMT